MVFFVEKGSFPVKAVVSTSPKMTTVFYTRFNVRFVEIGERNIIGNQGPNFPRNNPDNVNVNERR